MTTKKYILAIDQGTSGSKAIIFDGNGAVVSEASEALNTQHFENGFVEQDPEEIFENILQAVRKSIASFEAAGFSLNSIACCGISNQRETFILWDESGKQLSPAVVWSCKRSIDICGELKRKGQESLIHDRTGLIIDPYFSGTKLLWLLRNDQELYDRVCSGEVFFGTVDTWLLYKLSDGQVFSTDHTNASRTLLFNIHTLQWDSEILQMWGLENLKLPKVQVSASHFGETDFSGLFADAIPITAMIGDSHAAAFGEGCFEQGGGKVTLGTGSSIMVNVGDRPVETSNGMLSTICYSTDAGVKYALEGAIVACGSTLEWLRKEMHLFENPVDTEQMAMSVEDNGGVYLIPAFSGLGAPHWQMDRKASIEGMTFGTSKNHIVRAALESIAYQIKDVIIAMCKDMNAPMRELAVNGGISRNNFVIKFLADLLSFNLRKKQNPHISALGAAYLAGLQMGVFIDLQEIQYLISKSAEIIRPDLGNVAVQEYYEGWLNYVGKTGGKI